MDQAVSDQAAQEQLESGCQEAAEILGDEDKTEKFLQRLEKKLEVIPIAGKRLSNIPVTVSL